MRGERVLVTGGAGFIGSSPAEALAEKNDVYFTHLLKYSMSLSTDKGAIYDR
jgi:nucleoside-diphosphate-sugar epimerase